MVNSQPLTRFLRLKDLPFKVTGSVDLEREIEREERKIYLVKGLHLVKRSIPSKERAGGCRPPHPPLVKKSKVRLKLLT